MDSYKVSGKTKWIAPLALVAENPIMPTEFDRVELGVTPATFAIWIIRGVVKTDSVERAEAIGIRYSALLSEMYGPKCKILGDFVYVKGSQFICSDKYELSIRWNTLGFEMELQYRFGSPEAERIHSMIDKEEDTAKRRRLNDARNRGELRGLQ
ncbi:MAG TPA: hypothetical protein PLO41_11680 [Rubrivivax sp.]|nr:hypothetical protein [Rubrivivax sp.]